MTSFPQPGGCQCGSVRYQVTGPPRMVYACHCTECQRQSGAAFALAFSLPDQPATIQTTANTTTVGSDSLRVSVVRVQ